MMECVQRSPTLASLVVGLVVLSALFWVLERWRPSLRGQRRSAGDTRLDVAYWFFTPLVTRAVTRASVGAMFILVAISQGLTLDELQRAATTRRTRVSSLPLAAQVPLILLLADLLAYWSHRLFHGRWLWPIFTRFTTPRAAWTGFRPYACIR